LKREVKLHDSAFAVHADLLLDEVEKTDLIFIPAFVGDLKTAIEVNKDFIPWLVRQRERGAEIVSL
jgi:transcriptional regulator GlxA family with amidase domain